ncbi:MAG: hypothetical protein WBS14_20090 [Rhodomicrobium sp.]
MQLPREALPIRIIFGFNPHTLDVIGHGIGERWHKARRARSPRAYAQQVVSCQSRLDPFRDADRVPVIRGRQDKRLPLARAAHLLGLGDRCLARPVEKCEMHAGRCIEA